MSEHSFLWTTSGTGDGSASGYSAANLFDIFRALFTGASANAGGVAPDFSNELAVSGTSSPVAVASGAAIVYGIPYVNTASVNVTVATPASATRVDRIVLRADWTAQTVRITRIAGTEGAGAPSMTQSAGATWDVPLATVSITTAGVITVTDGREYLSAVGDGEVDTAKLADNAVTLAKMADNAIGTAEIVDAAVTLAKQANLAQATVIGRASGAGTGVPTALTAAQLLTILLAADGAGSGLDADLLDGQSGLYYAMYSAGTAAVDPDTVADPYRIINHANAPSTGDWHVITARYSALARFQIAARASSTTNPPIYFRVELSGTWSAWIQMITSVSGLVAGSVTATELASNAVTTAKILDDNVTQAKIAAGAVGTTELASNAVTTAKIADSNVTTGKIADDAVTTDKMAAGSITATELASNAVTTAKILDDNVTQAKIAAGAVGTTELADANVTEGKLAADSVTNAKLANMTQGTVKGRANGAGTGDPTDLTAAQVAAIVAAGDVTATTLTANAGWSIAMTAYKFSSGLVYLYGTVTYTSGVNGPFTLPSGLRPGFFIHVPLLSQTSSTTLHLVIYAAGTTEALSVAAGAYVISTWYMAA